MTARPLPDMTNRDYYIGLSRERGPQYALDVAVDDIAKLRASGGLPAPSRAVANALPEAVERASFEAWVRRQYGGDVTWDRGEEYPSLAPLPQYGDTSDPEEIRTQRDERSLWEEWSAWKARAALATPAEAVPVAWGVYHLNWLPTWLSWDKPTSGFVESNWRVVPLYATPAEAATASVERRLAFLDVERQVAEAVKAEREACATASIDAIRAVMRELDEFSKGEVAESGYIDEGDDDGTGHTPSRNGWTLYGFARNEMCGVLTKVPAAIRARGTPAAGEGRAT